MGHLMQGSGTGTFGHWEDMRGAQMTAHARHRPDILEAMRQVSRICFQLPGVVLCVYCAARHWWEIGQAAPAAWSFGGGLRV
eukprot:5975857-Pyramimonas_sp.AAC.1